MDAAARLYLAEMGKAGISKPREVGLPSLHFIQLADYISSLGVDVLICGAISRSLEERLNQLGVKTVSWISGNVHDVMVAYRTGELDNDDYFMPGYRRRGRCRRKGRGFGGGRLKGR